MELRRVQETGRGTLIISLPKGWARRNGVKKGNVLTVIEQPDGHLIIDSGHETPARPTEIVIPYVGQHADHIRWSIIGGYLLGRDLIRIHGEERIDPSDKELIKHTIRHLIGLEILEEDAYTIVAQCILDPSLLVPKKILRRMNVITIGMQEDAISSLLENEKKLAKAVVDRDNEVNRLYFLSVRLLRSAVLSPTLASKFGVSPIGCLDYRVAAHLIESIGDYSVQIADIVAKMPLDRPSEELMTMLGSLSKALSEIQNSAVDFLFQERVPSDAKVETLGMIRGRHYEFLEKLELLNELIAREPETLIPFLSTVSSLVDKIGGCCVDVADLSGTHIARRIDFLGAH